MSPHKTRCPVVMYAMWPAGQGHLVCSVSVSSEYMRLNWKCKHRWRGLQVCLEGKLRVQWPALWGGCRAELLPEPRPVPAVPWLHPAWAAASGHGAAAPSPGEETRPLTDSCPTPHQPDQIKWEGKERIALGRASPCGAAGCGQVPPSGSRAAASPLPRRLPEELPFYPVVLGCRGAPRLQWMQEKQARCAFSSERCRGFFSVGGNASGSCSRHSFRCGLCTAELQGSW